MDIKIVAADGDDTMFHTLPDFFGLRWLLCNFWVNRKFLLNCSVDCAVHLSDTGGIIAGYIFPEKEIEEIFHRYHTKNPVKAIFGMEQVLSWLQKENIPRVLITAAPLGMVEHKLTSSGMLGMFSEVDTSRHDKAEALESLAKKFQVPPASIIYIGDMKADMENARDAGVFPIGFNPLYEEGPLSLFGEMESVLYLAGARKVVSTASELKSFLESLRDPVSAG